MFDTLGRISSVNVARPATLRIRGREVETGIDKRPVDGPVAIDRMGLVGDRRVLPRKLGEENHAVHIYPEEHYDYWRELLGLRSLPPGHLGENLTARGVTEAAVRMGDVLRVGSAVLQITSPRIPCRRLNARVGFRFSGRFLRSRRTGYYLRVLEPGDVRAGDDVVRVDGDPDSPTVEAFTRLALIDYWDAEGLRHLLRSRDLIAGWREQLEEKLARAESADGWFGFRDLVVERRVEAGAEVVSLWLAPPDGRPLPPFAGGQYLTIAHRTDEEAVNDHRRAYAITNDPTAEAGYRITVRRRRGSGTEPPGLVSSHLYDAPVGARLRVAAPRGRLTLDALPGECPKLLLVSRGIGIAPMVSLVHHWARRGSPPEVRLLHEPIDGEPVPLLDELRAIEAAHPGFALRLVEPETLLPTALDEAAAEDARVFIAGSNAFVDRVEACLAARGVAPTRIHHERFGG